MIDSETIPTHLPLDHPARTLNSFMDKAFTKWWLGRIEPYRDVSPEKLRAEREAISKQQEYNENYGVFLNNAVFPSVDQLVQMMTKARIVHRVSTWGNQLSLRVHLSWRWGELLIMQEHEDAITFAHHIVTEGERRGDDTVEDHTHEYDIKTPLPGIFAEQEIQFFMSRLALDLVDPPEEPEIPLGEKPEE